MKRCRTQNDSSERTDLPIAHNSNLATEGCTYEKYRVGGPPLQLLPLRSISVHTNNPALPALGHLMPQIQAVLRENQVRLDDNQDMHGNKAQIEFMHRVIGYETPSLQNLTILIPAVWNDNLPYAWLHVVSELRTILVQNVHTRPIKVELIGRQLYEPVRVLGVAENHPIISIWNNIHPQIWAIVTDFSHLRNRLWSIGVRRMGPPHWSGTGSWLTTVIRVIVNWDVNPMHWENPLHLIKNLLIGYSMPDVDVVFSRGEIVNSFEVRTPNGGPEPGDIIHANYTQFVGMGSDIGPARYFNLDANTPINGPSGTLGGYIKVTDMTDGRWKIMGLTNYHEIRQAIKSFRFVPGVDGRAKETDPLPDTELDSTFLILHFLLIGFRIG